MPSIINATTTTGVAVTGDTSGALALQTNNGTTAVTIDTSQNVGIGTSSPSSYGKLAVTGVSNFGVDQTDYIGIQGGGGTARLDAFGSNTNINLALSTKGTGAFYIWRGGYGGTATMIIDGSSNLQFNSGYGSVATAYGCRAWVNFNGTGTVAIRASGNVSSIIDNGTGAYAINFTNAMPDANYSGNVSVASVPGTSDANFITTDQNNTARVNPTTSSFAFTCYRFQGSAIDTEFVRVAIFR